MPTAPNAAPPVMPRMSALASGLRETVWVSAPATPSAAPARMPATVRGARNSTTASSVRPSGAAQSAAVLWA